MLFRQRILLDEQIAGHESQTQAYGTAPVAVHAEYVDEAFDVSVGVAPLVVEQFDGSYSREFEEFARVAFGVVTPRLHIIGGERERLHAALSPRTTMSARILLS